MATQGEYGWNDTMDMPLVKKLKQDLKTAMLSKNEAVKGAIRVIMSEFPKITVPITMESGKKTTRPKTEEEITNEDIITVIQGLAKSEKTTLELQKQERSDYLDVLETYLPQQASEEEITAWIKENIDLSQFKSPMQAMGPIMKHFGKKADGNVVKQVLQKFSA